MRFLLDANLSPLIASELTVAGHVATHVRDLELNTSPDEEILDVAQRKGFVVISQDSDFTNLLVYRAASGPSLILLRNIQEVTAAAVAQLIVDNLDQFHDALEAGAVVSMMRDRARIRRLPIKKGN